MTFNQFYTTSSASYIKLQHICVHPRLSIQQGDCMAHTTLNSLTQTQYELLSYLPVWFPHCSWEMNYKGSLKPRALLGPGAPFHQHFLCHKIADRFVVSLKKTLQFFVLPWLSKAHEAAPHRDRLSGWRLVCALCPSMQQVTSLLRIKHTQNFVLLQKSHEVTWGNPSSREYEKVVNTPQALPQRESNSQLNLI